MITQSLASRIVHLLAEVSSDLFTYQSCTEELRGLGLDAIPILLSHAEPADSSVALALREVVSGIPTEHRERACADLTRAIRRDHSHEQRALALVTIGECLGDLVSYVDWVIPIALDQHEPADLRIRAINVLRGASLSAPQVRELVGLLNLAQLPNADIRSAVFSCLDRHANALPVKVTMDRLDPFLTHPDPGVRIHALGLLGAVGDLDAVERMCLLPNTTAEILQIQESIGRILLRPTNLIVLRAEHFEQFIAHFLRKLGHEDVEHVGRSHDGGVDVTSYRNRVNIKGPGREKWIVQCKRWTTKPVDLPDLEKLIDSSREQNAKHALLITTSDFTARARAFATKNSAAIELVSGTELLALLDDHFGPNRYTIRPHD